jgi:hypothetical protein
MKPLYVEIPKDNEHHSLLEDIPSKAKEIIVEELQKRNISITKKNIEIFLTTEQASDYEDVFDFLYVSPEVINLKKNKMALYEEKRFSLKQAIEDTLKTTKERQSFWEYDGNEQYKEETRRTIVALEGARHQMDLFLDKRQSKLFLKTFAS